MHDSHSAQAGPAVTHAFQGWRMVALGFLAVTLAIGLVLSLFTALTCTRTLLRLLMTYPGLRRSTYFLPAAQLPACIRPKRRH